MAPVSRSDRPAPIGAKRIPSIAGGSLAAVVVGCVEAAIEEMARERLAGSEVISWEEAGLRLEERQPPKRADAKIAASNEAKAPGCWTLLGLAFVALFLVSLLRSVLS